MCMSMEDIELVYAEPGESIVLYFKCRRLGSLLRLREMIVSGLLLKILSKAIKHFIQNEHQMRLVVKKEDFNMYASSFNRGAGKYFSFLYANAHDDRRGNEQVN